MSVTFHPTILVPIESIEDHPKNSNVVPDAVLAKLERNIKRSKFYPPLIVRELPGGRRIMLDGHHRRIVLRRLGYDEIEIKPVTCSDREELVMLASLNTLRGTEDIRKRAALIHDLSGTIKVEELALILPEDTAQVSDLLRVLDTDFVALEEAMRVGAGEGTEGPKARTFMLFPDQLDVVNQAIASMIADHDLGKMKNPEGAALEFLCAEFLAGRPASPDGPLAED